MNALRRGLRRGLIVGLLLVALAGTVQPQPAEASHGCPIDETGHRGWFICETHPARVTFDGRRHIFVTGTDYGIWYAWERWRGGPWSTWHTLGGEVWHTPTGAVSPYVWVEAYGGPPELIVEVWGINLRYYCQGVRSAVRSLESMVWLPTLVLQPQLLRL
jgi:hypothetical protein